jgi:GNAT superfamily N-acetyltransferase
VAGLRIEPLVPARWRDVEALFGPRGACAGCWCMYPRIPRKQWVAQKYDGNKRAFRTLVTGGAPTGVLGYLDGAPVAWCAIAPRPDFSQLGRSRILQPVDDQPVWSIVCLFVSSKHRRKGLSVAMINGAAAWANRQGARIVEAYPVEPRSASMPAAFAWWGTASAFARAGFREVARRADSRPIMRRTMAAPRRPAKSVAVEPGLSSNRGESVRAGRRDVRLDGDGQQARQKRAPSQIASPAPRPKTRAVGPKRSGVG